MKQYDYIVVGGGLAGLYAAYKASKHGKVALVTKADIRESNSFFAQGGIAAVTSKDDTPLEHLSDTMEAGRGLCELEAVKVLTEEAPSRINELIELGMHFDKEIDGELALGLEGGHHHKRILHAGGDSTGRMITSFMIQEVQQSENIDIFTNLQAIRLLINDSSCYGVVTWNHTTNKAEAFLACNIIMATGGSAALYRRTTNPQTTLGDGIAICYNAGCEVRDMEFVQFHPTALYNEHGEAFLISEAVRGEGAHLYNTEGKRFMVGVHELAELAPRDVVARQIFLEMRRLEQEYVYLRLDHLDPKLLYKRFPNIYEKCKTLGFDFYNQIPVAPAAHYTVGGVTADHHGRSSISHLYVIGELASTGIMGANRLASNSLIECLVFGHRAIEDTLGNPCIPTHNKEVNLNYYAKNESLQNYLFIKNKLAKLMMRYVGIIRNEKELSYAHAQIEEIRQNISKDSLDVYAYFTNQLLTVAELIIRGALDRKESRGGHYREDFPETKAMFRCHTAYTIN